MPPGALAAEGQHPGGLPKGRGWPRAEVPVPKLSDRAQGWAPSAPQNLRNPVEQVGVECWDAEEWKAVSIRSCRAGRKLLVVAETWPGDGMHVSLTLWHRDMAQRGCDG